MDKSANCPVCKRDCSDLEAENLRLRNEIDALRGLDMKCDKCGQKIAEPGAIVFGPPGGDQPGTCMKFHICVECFGSTDYPPCLHAWLEREDIIICHYDELDGGEFG